MDPPPAAHAAPPRRQQGGALRPTALAEHGPAFLLLLLFAAVYSTTLDSHGMFWWDEAEYASIGRSVLRGEGFSISGKPNLLRPPTLPLAAAASMLVSGRTDDVVLKIPNLAFSLLSLLAVYASATAQFDRATGFISAFCLGVLPFFWRYTARLMAELPFMAFFGGAVFLLYFGFYRDRRLFWWSWLCVGLSLLTRYTGVLFAPIFVAFLLSAVFSRKPDVQRRIWSWHFILSPLLALAVLAPWLARQHATFGDALIGFTRSATQLQLYQPDIAMPWHFYFTALPRMLSPGVTALLVLGAAWAIRTRDRCGLHCLFVVLGVVLWFSFYRYKEPRLVSLVLPFAAVLASLGVTRLMISARANWPPRGLLPILLGGIFAMNLVETRSLLQREVTLGYPPFRDAMRFLRRWTPSDTVLVGASVPQIFWYTDRRVVNFPDQDGFTAVLEQSEWVIVTNFEPTQKDYARQLLSKVSPGDVRNGDVVRFADGRVFTVLIRSSLLKRRLS